MSLLTEQEINKCIGITDNTTGAMKNMLLQIARAIEAKVIEKIKAQGPVVWMAPSGSTVLNEDVAYTPNWTDCYTAPLYKLPEGD